MGRNATDQLLDGTLLESYNPEANSFPCYNFSPALHQLAISCWVNT